MPVRQVLKYRILCGPCFCSAVFSSVALHVHLYMADSACVCRAERKNGYHSGASQVTANAQRDLGRCFVATPASSAMPGSPCVSCVFTERRTVVTR